MKFLPVIFFILICQSAIRLFAQSSSPTINQSVVNGLVKDARTGAPIIGATVYLFKDEIELRKNTTDDKGNFGFINMACGAYRIEIAFVGYSRSIGETLLLNSKSSTKSIVISLIPSERELKEIAIVGTKQYIEHKIDRTTINVSSLLSNAGTNVVEVLNNMPGIEVIDNSVSMRGKSGVSVYIDGRQAHLAGKDLINYLQSLPSGTIDKIEIIPNPPANFHVNGNSGVINIITKKNIGQGFNANASLSYGQGRYGKTINTIGSNYKTGKFNFYGSLGYTNTNNYYDVHRIRFINGNSAPYVVDQNVFERNDNKGYNYKAGLDYEIDKYNSLQLAFNNIRDDYRERGSYRLNFKQAAGALDSTIKTNSELKEKTKTQLINLSYVHKMKQTDQRITFDFDYLNYDKNAMQGLLTDSYLPGNTTAYSTYSLNTDNVFKADIYSTKVDYNTSVLRGIKLSAGIQTIYSTRNSSNHYTGQLADFNLEGQSLVNLLKYREGINGTYLNLSKSMKRVSVQAGLRYEQTNAEIDRFQNGLSSGSAIKYNFGNLIPTAYLSYKLDSAGVNELIFSFGRRVSRPDYQDLNPSVFFFDKYTSNQGNAFLQPERSSNFDFSYNRGNNFSFGTAFSFTGNKIIQFYKFINNALIFTSVNVDKVTNLQFYSNYSAAITDRWSVNLYEELTHSSYKGLIADQGYLKNTVTAFRFTGSSQFKFSNTWNAELNGQYRSKRTLGQGFYQPLWLLNASVHKKIFNNKAAVSLVARDIFHSSVIKRDIDLNNARILLRNESDTQMITLNFTYKFGSGGNGKSPKSGLENEQKRIGL